MGVVSQPFSHALMSPGSHKLFRNVTHPPVPLTPMVNGWAVKARLYSCPCSSLLLVLTQLVIILVFIGHQRSLTYQRGKNEELSVLEANPSDGSEREAITDRFHAHFLSAREDGRRNPYREEEGEGEGRADYSKRGVGKDGDMTVENAITSRHTSRPTRLRKTTSFTPTENQTQNTPANPTTSRHEIVAFNGTANQTRNTPKKATASSSRRTIRRTIRRTNKSTAVNPTANQTQNTPANSTTTRRRKREFTPAANQTIKTAKNPTTSRSTSRRKREVQKTEFNPSAYKHNKTAEYPTTKQGKKAAFKPSSNERNHTDVYEIDIAARRAGINRSSTLHIAFGSLFSYMYSPFIETLVSGAESIGISYLIHGIGTDISFHLGQLRKVGEIGYARMYGLKSAIDDPNSPLYFLNQTKRGDVLVWIGVLAKQGEVPWRVLQKRGLYTAKYQLEPATRSPRSVCTEDIGIREADEMWDYSMSNIRHIKAHCPPKSATFRHIPAGYQHNSPKVKQKLHGPQHNKFNQTGKVYFLGNLHYGDRRECLYDIRKSSPRGIDWIIQSKRGVFSRVDFSTFLLHPLTTGIFYNMHQDCLLKNNVSYAAEPRLSQLLSAKGLLISQECDPIDEGKYRGLVDFVPLNATGQRIKELTSLSLQQRQALADSRFKIFKKRFDPYKIFKDAGLFHLFKIGKHQRHNSPPAFLHLDQPPC